MVTTIGLDVYAPVYARFDLPPSPASHFFIFLMWIKRSFLGKMFFFSFPFPFVFFFFFFSSPWILVGQWAGRVSAGATHHFGLVALLAIMIGSRGHHHGASSGCWPPVTPRGRPTMERSDGRSITTAAAATKFLSRHRSAASRDDGGRRDGLRGCQHRYSPGRALLPKTRRRRDRRDHFSSFFSHALPVSPSPLCTLPCTECASRFLMAPPEP